MADHGRRARVPRHAAVAPIAARGAVHPGCAGAGRDRHAREQPRAGSAPRGFRRARAARRARQADAGGTPRLRAARHVRRAVRGDRADRRPFPGGGAAPDPDLVRQREVVEAFVAALRAGDFEGLLAVLDPDLVVRADMPVPSGAPTEIRGAAVWAKGAIAYGHLARLTQPALVNGAIGVVVAPRGRLV